jgi:hypothetical protein
MGAYPSPSAPSRARREARVDPSTGAGRTDGTNSRSEDTSVHLGVFEAGVDTCRFLWRIDSEHDRNVLRSLPRHAAVDGIPDLHLDYDGASGVLAAEGRVIEAVGLDTHRLLPPAALPDAHDAVRRAVRSMGLHYLPEEGVSRLDATVTLRMGSPAMGWSLLSGMAALDTPRLKPLTIGRPLETVKWVTPRRAATRATAYDKGHQLLTAEQGTEIRLEARHRYSAQARRRVAEWRPGAVRESFETRFDPMRKSAEGVHIASERLVREMIREHVASGVITSRQAELLLGHIGCEATGIRTHPKTQQRRRRELRRLGLALAMDGDEGEPINVELQALLDEVLTSAAWDG